MRRLVMQFCQGEEDDCFVLRQRRCWVNCPPLRWGHGSSTKAGGELEVMTELGGHVRPDVEAVVIEHGSRRCHRRRGRSRRK